MNVYRQQKNDFSGRHEIDDGEIVIADFDNESEAQAVADHLASGDIGYEAHPVSGASVGGETEWAIWDPQGVTFAWVGTAEAADGLLSHLNRNAR